MVFSLLFIVFFFKLFSFRSFFFLEFFFFLFKRRLFSIVALPLHLPVLHLSLFLLIHNTTFDTFLFSVRTLHHPSHALKKEEKKEKNRPFTFWLFTVAEMKLPSVDSRPIVSPPGEGRSPFYPYRLHAFYLPLSLSFCLFD